MFLIKFTLNGNNSQKKFSNQNISIRDCWCNFVDVMKVYFHFLNNLLLTFNIKFTYLMTISINAIFKVIDIILLKVWI